MTVDEFIEQWHDAASTIEVTTSGSTGMPKVMHVEKHRMLASARTTCDFLGLIQGDTALLCMSVDYIAGKMMVVRAIERNLKLMVVPASSHPLSMPGFVDEMGQNLDFAAMVPMQVYCSLRVPRERQILSHIRHIIIGGGPLETELEEQLHGFENAIWHSYGMTETLSHIALRRVSGKEASSWFSPMPGVTVGVDADNCLMIDAPHLCPQRLVTHDVVEMEPGTQRFRVLGRIDNVINSGGVKIHIEQVEKVLASHLSRPFFITKCPDAKYGEIVVMLVQGAEANVAEILEKCRRVLPRYACPKHVLMVPELPYTPTGKPARAQALTLARQLLMNHS